MLEIRTASAAAAAMLLACLAGSVNGQNAYPVKPIRIITRTHREERPTYWLE